MWLRDFRCVNLCQAHAMLAFSTTAVLHAFAGLVCQNIDGVAVRYADNKPCECEVAGLSLGTPRGTRNQSGKGQAHGESELVGVVECVGVSCGHVSHAGAWPGVALILNLSAQALSR